MTRSDWTKREEDNVFTQIILNPESIEHYQRIFSDIQHELNKIVLEQAQRAINTIESDFSPALLGTETVASILLDAKRVVSEIEIDGVNVVTIDTPSVSIISSKTPLILSISALLGGMAAIFYIVIRSVISKRKEPFPNET